MNQQAIEAATEAHLRHQHVGTLNLGQGRYRIGCSCGYTYQIDWYLEGRQEQFQDHVNSDVLTAAYPHIEAELRKQIAAEILESHRLYECHEPDPQSDNHPRACIWEIAQSAARDVEGKDQP